ncbi:hypothetical protein V6N13_142735 [Hibiscus sabdariffa]
MGNAEEIVLKVYMHCQGCASEVSDCLKGFQGVEEVETDIGGDRVKVKGQKADPFKIPIEVVSLKTYMHCEGCANDIVRSIEKMKGILNVEADMKKSTVTITGSFDRSNIAETIRRRMRKHVEIVTAAKPKKNGDGNDNKKGDGNAKKKGDDQKIILNYPPQYSSQNICPNHIFSDENIFSCSLM